MYTSTLTLFALALVLAGCRDAPAPAVPAPPAAAPATPAPPASVRPPEVSPALIATPAEVAAMKLALDGEGLRLFNAVSGASRLLAFGLPRTELIDALSRALQSRPVREADVEDCGARTAAWSNGLQVWFTQERFSGWSVQASDARLTTASGIGPGTTRRELDSAYNIALVPDSTLGTEFTAGALAGLLASGAPGATITNLWAGNTCIAR